MKILGKFNKDNRYTIAEIDGEPFALYNLDSNGIYERKHECKEFAPGLYGIGPEITEQLETKFNEAAMSLTRFPVKVEWENIGEGLSGDYNPLDPEDINLLRFYVSVFRNGEWEEKEDASYCTYFPANASIEEKKKGLQLLLERFYEVLSEDINACVKKLGEELSYISLDSIARKNSIIDLDVILKYEQDTGIPWRNDVEERMAKICSFYDYGFNWNEKGNIVINNFFYEGFFEGIHIDEIDGSIYDFQGKNIEQDIQGHILRHYEYTSAKDMILDWLHICKETNADYLKNGLIKPFPWTDEYMNEKSSLNVLLEDAKNKHISYSTEKTKNNAKEIDL